MLSFAWEGITSLSTKPYYFDHPSGHADLSGEYRHADLFCSAALYGSHYYRLDFADVSIWAIGGLQLLAIGVTGQYIGKVYLETKERPKYIVETYLSDENENSKEE